MASARPSLQDRSFLEPIIIDPAENHKQTIIVLHGRGSTAQKFAEPFVSHPVARSPLDLSESKTFQQHLPHVKFVFPTAAYRRATVFNRSFTHQWFDSWTLDRLEFRQDLQQDGLRESVTYIHSLLKAEIDVVGAKNIVLLGMSQGCATMLVSLLLWEGEEIAAGIGMCGWLPFRRKIEESLEVVGAEAFFEHDGIEINQRERTSKLEQTMDWLKEELEFGNVSRNSSNCPLSNLPIFLGHGTKDEKVPVGLGREAAGILKELEVDVNWNEYERLGHWYSSELLGDVLKFMSTLPGWEADYTG
jgi:predicted esterase